MSKAKLTTISLFTSIALLAGSGCAQLPGDRPAQGAVIGGVGGAAAGAAVGGERHRLLGAVLGGLIGAGSGYVIGARLDRVDDPEAAEAAVLRSQERPATPEDALAATTADLNNDGFVTLDEVVAMNDAGFSDERMIEYMERTNQVFELTPEQRDYLLGQGISRRVVAEMERINLDQRQQLRERTDVIGQPRLD